MTYSNQLKLKADALFWIFEHTYFQNKGNYPRKTNLVLEFSEFIENSTQQDLEKFISFENTQEYIQLKSMISYGIDAWLAPEDVKTLLIS